MTSSSSSGLTFKLHPLLIVNISDHYTRVKSQLSPPPNAANNGDNTPYPRVYGCVIGVQRERTVEICNSFQLLYDPTAHSLDRTFLEKKQELYKKVFPKFYVLGWYSTGSDAEESDMHIHKALMDINASPVYVLLNPLIKCSKGSTFEAERISVDHVAHLKPSDGGSAATQCQILPLSSVAAQLSGIHSSIKMLMLNSRISVLHHYLAAMQNGEIPYENSLLRQVSSLLRRLPVIESEKFQDDFMMEYNDTLLITYLAMFTNCSSTMNELVDKFNTAYDTRSRRGGRTAFI